MANMANVLKLMSNFFRKSSSLPRHTSKNFCAHFSSVTKDLLRTLPKEQSAIHNQDILLGSLKTAASTANVLEIVKSHAVVMNNKHLMQALRSLFALQKSGQSQLSTQQILKHPDFEILCKTLRKHSGTIELNETIEALKVVSYVGVASNSTIMQVLLQLLRHQVNYLTLQQIIFLDFLLNQMKSTPLIEAMQLALPLIFEIQLSTKLDRDNIHNLADCLLFASRKDVSAKCVDTLVGAIDSYVGPMETKTAMSILWSLCEFPPNASFETLVPRLIEELILDIDALNYGDVETTLSKLTLRYSTRYPFYYSDIFCDLVASYVLDQDLGCEAAVFILKKLNRIKHSNDKLLNYVSEKYMQDPNLFHHADVMHSFNYINSLALTDVRPLHWDRIKTMITGSSIFKSAEKRDLIWLRLAGNLCLLDIYKTDILELAFRESYLKRVFQANHPSDYEHIVLVNQAVKSCRPELASVLPNEQIIHRAALRVKTSQDFPLEGALLNVFGGEKYVKTDVWTKLHHHIDHLLVLRKGGFPVAFATPDSPKYLEDVETSVDSQIVAIVALASHHFTTNSKRLISKFAMMLRTLEMRGCLVVPINVTDWTKLPDFERIPYLMQLIKNKTNENELVSKEIL